MSGRLDTPWERWSRDPRQLRLMSPDELEQAFVLFLRRTPSNDGLVPLGGVDYELPLELHPGRRARAPVQIVYRLLSGTYHVVVGDGLVQIHPVDLEANARAPRGRPAPGEEGDDDSEPPPRRSAADMAFERDLGPVTGPDGGFVDPNPTEEPDA